MTESSRYPRFACLIPYGFWLSNGILGGVRNYAGGAGKSGDFLPIWIDPFNLQILKQQTWLEGLVAFAATEPVVESLQSLALPVINISAGLGKQPFPSVLNDEHELGKQAAEHLIESGADSILYLSIGAGEAGFRKDRLEGARKACADKGRGFEQLIIEPPRTTDLLKRFNEQVRIIERRLAREREPVAIVAESPRVGVMVQQAVDRSDKRIGVDVALIHLTHPDEENSFSIRNVSYIPHDWPAVGQLAAQTLLAWVDDGAEPARLQLVPPLPAVLTSSSDASAGKDLALRVRSLLRHSDDYGLTTEEIARQLRVSQSTLYRKFRSEMGHSLKRELVLRKLHKAQDLLRNSNLPVADIAALCGYSSSHNFAAAFREEFGTTPMRWRQSAGA